MAPLLRDPTQAAQPPERRASARWLLLSFIAVIASFGASTAYSQHRAAAISTAAQAIAQDATPSIEALASIRAELRNLGLLVDDYLEDAAAGRTADPELMAASLRQIDERLDHYFSLPAFSGERDLWQQLQREMGGLNDAVLRLRKAVAARDLPGADRVRRHDVRQAIAGTADTILRLIDQNARRAHDLALRVNEIRRRSLRVAVGLDLLSAILAIVAAALTLQALRRYEQALELSAGFMARRAEELEQFASRVAHDIRGPLSAVGLALELVRRRAREQSAEPVARAKASLERVEWIIHDLLLFARAGAAPEPGAQADVSAILGGLVAELRPLAEDACIDLCVEPFRGCAVACGAGILSSVLSNLLRNAIKYMGQSPIRRVCVRVLPGDTAVRIEVHDTGPGIAPELLPKVFDPYVRGSDRSQPGLGLGLATVKRICESHGGRVGAQSAVGKGSRFWFELPLGGAARREEALDSPGEVLVIAHSGSGGGGSGR